MMNEEMTQAFQNHREAALHVIEECEAFIGMDINQQPQEAIFVGIKAELVEKKASIRATQARAKEAESKKDSVS